MLVMTAFGFASGFPFLLVFSTLSLWLKEAGFSLLAIGAFSLVKIPYSFKWLWSPLVDKIKLPFLWQLGRRRSWAFLMQICVFVSILLMASINNPSSHKTLMLVYAIMVSFSSATLDIVLDAYRVEYFNKEPQKQAAASAVFVLGWRKKEDIFCCGVFVLVFLRKCGIMRVVNVWSGVWLSKSKS